MRTKLMRTLAMLGSSVMVLAALGIGVNAEESIPTLEEALNPTEVVELDLWCCANESDSYHNAYVTAIEDFEATYPNVKINVEYFGSESYKTKLKSAMAANEVPDLVYSWQGGFTQGFAEAGKLINLEPYYTANYTELLPEGQTLNGRYVDNSVYAVGYTAQCSALMYNKEIFETYGLTAPETWDDFMNICQTLVDNGVKPISTSVKDTWCLAVIHDAIALKSVGPEKLVSTLKRQGGSYEDEDFLFAAQQIEKLVEMGAFIDGAAGLGSDEQREVFLNGDAAMMFQLASVCKRAYNSAEDPDKFDVVPVPVVGENASVTDIIGGASNGLLACSTSENPHVAAYTAFELARRIGANAQAEGVCPSLWVDAPEAEASSEFVQKVDNIIASATSSVIWWDTLMNSDDAAEYLSLLQQLYVGDITAEEFVSGMAYQLS